MTDYALLVYLQALTGPVCGQLRKDQLLDSVGIAQVQETAYARICQPAEGAGITCAAGMCFGSCSSSFCRSSLVHLCSSVLVDSGHTVLSPMLGPMPELLLLDPVLELLDVGPHLQWQDRPRNQALKSLQLTCLPHF